MSRINGEKSRASIARRNRTARREKDRARLAEIRAAVPAAEKTGEPKREDANKSN